MCLFFIDFYERISKVLIFFNFFYSYCSFVFENMFLIERKKLIFKVLLKEYYGIRMKLENIFDFLFIFCCC